MEPPFFSIFLNKSTFNLLLKKGSPKPLLSTKSAFDLGFAGDAIVSLLQQLKWTGTDVSYPPRLTGLNSLAQAAEMLVRPLQSACSLWEAGSLVTRMCEQPVAGRGDSGQLQICQCSITRQTFPVTTLNPDLQRHKAIDVWTPALYTT